MTQHIKLLKIIHGQSIKGLTASIGIGIQALILFVGTPAIFCAWYWISFKDYMACVLDTVSLLSKLAGRLAVALFKLDSSPQWPLPLRLLEHSYYGLTEAQT